MTRQSHTQKKKPDHFRPTFPPALNAYLREGVENGDYAKLCDGVYASIRLAIQHYERQEDEMSTLQLEPRPLPHEDDDLRIWARPAPKLVEFLEELVERGEYYSMTDAIIGCVRISRDLDLMRQISTARKDMLTDQISASRPEVRRKRAAAKKRKIA